MGITIGSKRFSADMGYFGFRRFRILVAEKISEEVGSHYKDLENAPYMGDRDSWFKLYDDKTKKLIKDKKLSLEVANFLYQSDCNGKIDRKQAKIIYELIKNEDDSLIYGYQGRQDCAKMKDMKDIFSDKTKVEWF